MTPRRITLLMSVAALVQLFILGHATMVDDSQMHIDKDQLRQNLIELFSEERNDARMEEKRRVRQEIISFFEKIKSQLPAHLTNRLEISEHTYQEEHGGLNGTNIILMIKGERFGTSKDQLSLVGAHYDSQRNSPGVNDNGSGMAAMLAIANHLGRAMAVQQCPFLNTIIVAAFDHEEDYLVGSSYYAKYMDEEILQKFGVKNFTGAFILETMMNFDTTNNSQSVPPGINMLFPNEYKLLEENTFRGDFMLAITRKDDALLSKLFSEQWYQLVGGDFKTTNKYREFDFALPMLGNPRDWPQAQWMMVRDFFRSDHYSFWRIKSNYTQDGLKAIMITDTAEFRGVMQTCYHQTCDDLSTVNDDKLEFLQIGAEAVLRSLTILSTGSRDMICLNRAAAMPGFSFVLLLTILTFLFA